MIFAVDQEHFSGPLGLLLELLQQKELEITKVSLEKITEDYLGYLEANDVPPEELADFLVVATRLIYLKSRELMPYLKTAEEEAEVQSLEDQLRLYRLFLDAAGKIEEQFAGSHVMFAAQKPRVVQDEAPAFVASEAVTPTVLHEAFGWVLKRLEPFFALREASMERVKSIEERLDEMRQAIASRASMSFKDVVRGAKSKPEVVVSFLALLELIRRQIVRASQADEHDILIERL